MSFKTAPNYLSGVSVFYGDDITKRSTDGELVVFMGPATKGPSTPVDLGSIDNLVAIYGNNNPLATAAFEFWDGYMDSKQIANLRPVCLRVGGIPSSVSFSFDSLVITTTDAYNGIENDFYVYIDNIGTPTGANLNIKIWDKNRLKVYDQLGLVNTGHFTISGSLTGGSNQTYGTDLEGNPTAVGVTLGAIGLLDIQTIGSVTGTNVVSGAVGATLSVTGDINKFPISGSVVLTGTVNSVTQSQTIAYSSINYQTNTITLSGIPTYSMASYTVSFVGSTTVLGDSQLGLSARPLYELYRNQLLQVETYTPDYLVPGGVTWDQTNTLYVPKSVDVPLVQPVTNSSAYIYVSGASSFLSSGVITLPNATIGTSGDKVTYKSKTQQGSNYALEVSYDTFTVGSTTLSGSTTLGLQISGSTTSLTKLNNSGAIKIGATVYYYTAVSILSTTATLTLTAPTAAQITSGTSVTKVPAAIVSNTGVTVNCTWNQLSNYELGIGYVKETKVPGGFTFQWGDLKNPPIYAADGITVTGYDSYNLAHFGYMFAKFCNNAAVGYNTPLCAMNVSLPSNATDRVSIANWIGTQPTYTLLGGVEGNVTAVGATGTGILGDPVMMGSVHYNRTSLSDPLNGQFKDPAYGLLLTDEGFIDGGPTYDTYNKLVDLGKYMCVGAGLLNFSNRAKSTSYTDACGLYALGLLAGSQKNEGISFSQIGINSAVSITTVINRKTYNDLAKAGYIVLTREKNLGWVINNDTSAARSDSAYFLISTTRTIKYVVEAKRAILVGFIGKPLNTFYLEAARTKVAESFANDVKTGFLNGFTFSLDPVVAATAIGKLLLKTSLNPALELVQVDIDSVIDRNVTNQA